MFEFWLGFGGVDQATNVDDKRSTFSYCFYLGLNLVSWFSKKQHIISRSSIGSKYKSLTSIVAELTWLCSLLGELRIPISKPPIIRCGNLGTILLVANPMLHAWTKHIELDLYFFQEKGVVKKGSSSTCVITWLNY